ncbi:HesB/IscA family protein [Chitinophaga vietnamensis]|uniref:HesB/IscA family protein n=1 Tax=Chitinophaga vietnamensis TaxID=2593957 RepID=UPI0011782C1F|nr:iron-sulfur cluster assembly accessory protein [Chitinophaga vietnamensis]
MNGIPIRLTDNAVNVLKKLLEGGTEAPYLRVGVKGGGCSGMAYMLGFDAKQADDEQFEIAGIPVIMKKAHAMHLMGIEIDYRQEADTQGFVFNS